MAPYCRPIPYPIGLCAKWCSKELRESTFLLLSLLLKAQCRLNLAKINQTNCERRKKVISDKRRASEHSSLIKVLKWIRCIDIFLK